jgi:carotenoid cleavage dioxygenase-like enzyme
MSSTVTAAATEARPRYGLGFEPLEQETTIERLELDGSLPAWLSGTLLRNGPARFDVGDSSLNHWFDGLAMLHRFSFDEGEVSYANRFLRSRAWHASEEEGAISYREFASDPCRSFFSRVATMFAPEASGSGTDNANVNITRFGDRFVALTEVPLPIEFDPVTLETAGVVDYEKKVKGVFTTAHPHQDPVTGELVNYMLHLGPRSFYRVYSQAPGSTRQRQIAAIPVRRPAYMHSFAITERYIVLAEFPFTFNPIAMALSGRPFIENYHWKPERGTRFVVVDKAAGKVRSRHQGAACFAFHHVNAFEDGDQLVIDMAGYDDHSIVRSLYLDNLRSGNPVPHSRLRRFRLPLDGGDAADETIGDVTPELPRIDYGRRNGRDYRFVYGIGGSDERTFVDLLTKLDVHDGSAVTWSEDGCYPGEPVFVREPGTDGEDDGVVLSVVLDADSGSSFLLVLDARTLEERARARVPHHIPFGFHGMFSRTAG